MKIVRGQGVCKGIAIGKVQYYRHQSDLIKKRFVRNTEQEILRFHAAKQKEIGELEGLYRKAFDQVGERNAQIFKIHQMMLEDLEFGKSVENFIRGQHVNVEYAVACSANTMSQTLANMDDDYLQGRAADVHEVFGKLVKYLTGEFGAELQLDHPVVLVADDLSPSETIKMDRSKILAIITAQGTCNSHTAILARSMNIPAIVAAGDSCGAGCDGAMAIVDGRTGEAFIDPDKKTLEKYTAEREKEGLEEHDLKSLVGLKNETKSGEKILIYANVAGFADIQMAQKYDAEGVGLFRSEFIYLGRNTFPTEQEQFEIYKQAVQSMGEKEIIIRTLDVGADKQVDYLRMPKEQNPALGCRAVRFCLTQPEIFKTQLRALYRASAFGRLLIMFPMITSVQEVGNCKGLIREVCSELTEESISYDPDVPIGIMIETPAAALTSGELAKEVDFFSIGTNDLTQYTLAMDRQNPTLERFFNSHHPAILQLIRMTAENAHQHGIRVGICGELGADESLLPEFLNMGIDELSVSPLHILPLRKAIREM